MNDSRMAGVDIWSEGYNMKGEMSIGEQDKEEKSVQKGLHPACPCQAECLLRESKRFLHAGAFTSQLREGLVLGLCVQEAQRR